MEITNVIPSAFYGFSATSSVNFVDSFPSRGSLKNQKNLEKEGFKKVKFKKILALLLCFAMVLGTMSIPVFADGNVAKVGNTEYKTIDEAIANWTNGTTLTLLADVTLSDVIKLSSTEYHILDLGTYTMTAASGKDAIQYVVNGRSSAGYALDIKADATNPGGITATGKTIVSHIKPSSSAPSKDRPITRFYGGVFNASYVVKQGGSGLFLPGAGYTGASAPYFQFYGGVYNGTIYTNRSQNQFHGGTFNGSMQMSVDSSAYTLIAGGTFKNLSNIMGSALNSDKFVIGTAKGANNGSVCIDENGYYVISTTTPTEAEASVASSYNSNNYFYYSTVNTNGMYYEDVYDALEANTTGTITVLTDELDLTDSSFTGTIVVPEGETLTIIVEEGTTPAWTIDDSTEAAVTYTDSEGNELVTDDAGSFAPVDFDADITVDGIDVDITPVDGIENSYEITLAEGATWPEGTSVTMTFPAVEGASDGDSAYVVHEHEDGTYIYVGEVADGSVTITNTVGFSTFTVYDGDFNDALIAANACTGDVTIEIYGEVEFVDGMELDGSYTSITFNGVAEGAKITINQTAGGDYLTAHGKTVAFNNLFLAKATPAWSGNSGHMGNYFSVQGGTVTYTNCTFPNGACTSGGTATYNNCTFQNTSEYGLWVYDDALVTVNGGTIDSTKGIKVYSEGEDSVTSTLTVEGATFTENVTAKPAIAVGYAAAITLIDNTYNNSTAVIELDSGSDADCNGIEFVAEDAEGNDISSTLTVVDRSNSSAACGVLVDGKIYTTVAQAAEAATEGSTVTLLYDTTETVEFAEGVTLNLNGHTANNVTVATPLVVAQIGDVKYTDLQTALKALTSGATLILLDDVTITEDWDCRYTGVKITDPVTIDGNGKTIKLTGSVKDNNWNTVFRFEQDATVKNLTIDASEATDIQRGISSKYSIIAENCNFIGNGASCKRAIIFGEGAGSDISNVTATITNCTFINWSYGVSDNQSGKDAKSVSVTNSTFTNASALVSASKAVTFTGNTVTNGYVNITSYTAADTAVVKATGNTLAGTDDEITVNPENIEADNTFVTPVSKIGSKYYETLSKALDAAQAGDTITLLADATPELTSQRAITNASVIDLGGKTLTLTEDDLYFGTTTFKNGKIVVDPSVKPSTAVFWMFENQTLTFDGVEIVATGVTGTYLIGINGGTGTAVNLVNSSKITIENSTVASLTAVICDNGNGNSVTIENSELNIKNIDGRAYLGGKNGSITVKDSAVTLDGVKEGFYLRAGQTLSVEGTSNVAITLNSNEERYGINVTDSTATYTKADTATVIATVYTPPITANAYVAQDTLVNGWTTVWGQLAITGTESFYIEIYSGETYLGKTTLVDTDNVILDGTSHEVTWHAFLDGEDAWWNTEWTVEPVYNLAPTDVKYYVDGEQIGSGVVKMSSADDLNPVVWAELRGVKKEDLVPLQNILAIYNMNTKTQDGVIYYPVHVYAGIDSLNYKEVGFKLKAVNKNNPEGVSYTPTTKTVYKKMNVRQVDNTIKEYDASELGGTYMFGHEMLFKTSSWKNADTTIYVTPYAIKLDGTEKEGKTIILTDERIKTEVDKNLSLFKESSVTEEEN